METRRALLVQLFEVMTTDCFEKKFSLLALEVMHFPELVLKVDVPASKSIYQIIKKKGEARCKPLKKSMLSKSLDLVLEEIWAEQV